MKHAVRLALDDRQRKTSDTNFRAKLKAWSDQVDTLRKKIVATKEGGAITGEERLREFTANLYGDLIGYEGRPSAMQIARADSLTRELGDVRKAFDDWLANNLPAINTELTRYKMETITMPAVSTARPSGSGGAGGHLPAWFSRQ